MEKPKLQSQSLKEQAYDALLDRLLRGEFRPGDVMDRRSVALGLGMSVSPVHEAMLQLQFEGLLETVPRRGTLVKRVGGNELWGHLVLREAFERQAGRMLEPTGLQAGEVRLRELAAQVDSTESEVLDRGRSEVEFHVFLVSLAGCPELTAEYARIMRVGLFYRVSMLLPMPKREIIDPHEILVENLLANSREAETLLLAHMWSGKPSSLREKRQAGEPNIQI